MPGLHGQILTEICYSQALNGYAFGSYKYYAEKCSCDRRTVIRAVARFEAAAGLVQRTRKLRLDGSYGPNELRVDWGHEYFVGCPLKRSATSTSPDRGSVNATPASGNAYSLEDQSVSQSSSVFERSATDSTKSTEPGKPLPLKVGFGEVPRPPDAEVTAFDLGLRDRCHVRLEAGLLLWLVWTLAALKWNKLTFLKWVERNHNPSVFYSPQKGWRHIMRQYRDRGPVFDAPYSAGNTSGDRLRPRPESGRSRMPLSTSPHGMTGTASYLIGAVAPAPPAEPPDTPPDPPTSRQPEPDGSPAYDYVEALHARGVSPILFSFWRREASGDAYYEPPQSEDELDGLLAEFSKAYSNLDLRCLPRPRSELPVDPFHELSALQAQGGRRVTADEVSAWLRDAGANEAAFLNWLWEQSRRPRYWPPSEAVTRFWIDRYLAQKASG